MRNEGKWAVECQIKVDSLRKRMVQKFKIERGTKGENWFVSRLSTFIPLDQDFLKTLYGVCVRTAYVRHSVRRWFIRSRLNWTVFYGELHLLDTITWSNRWQSEFRQSEFESDYRLVFYQIRAKWKWWTRPIVISGYPHVAEFRMYWQDATPSIGPFCSN